MNSPKQSLVQRGTNSDTFEKKPSWFLQHFLQHFNNISLASTFVSKCACIWDLKYHKEVISTYELFFQVKEVALEASLHHFDAEVRIPTTKTVLSAVCEITFMWRSTFIWMSRRKANNYHNLVLQCKHFHALTAKTIFTYAYKYITYLTNTRTATTETAVILGWHFKTLIIES